jgi:hypothetical protein
MRDLVARYSAESLMRPDLRCASSVWYVSRQMTSNKMEKSARGLDPEDMSWAWKRVRKIIGMTRILGKTNRCLKMLPWYEVFLTSTGHYYPRLH